MRQLLKTVKEKLASKYLKSDPLKRSFKSIKKFKPRIKARIRKNKQIISKNIEDLFGWIKGAELVELKECNTDEDPVRPELSNSFRTSCGRKIYGVKYIGSVKALTTSLMVFSTAFGTALFGILIDNGFSIEQIALISATYISIAIISLYSIRNKLNPEYL